MTPFTRIASCYCLSNWRNIQRACKWAATGEIVANGYWATGLFLCNKNIFGRYDFPLSLEDTHASPVNHPVSVNISDQPSYSSANISPFTSAVPLWSSDSSSALSLNLKSNPCGGTTKKITSSPYKKFVETTQKREIKQAITFKTNWFALNCLLGPSKRQKKRVCWDATLFDTPSDSDTDLAVPFTDDLM
jgi:hypothetical protein